MNLLEILPTPSKIQDRLGELAREEKLLNHLLRLAIRAHAEHERRGHGLRHTVNEGTKDKIHP